MYSDHNHCNMSAPAPASSLSIDSGSAASLHPQEFFTRYIATRKPFKFTDFLYDPEFKVSRQLWTDDYLTSMAGDAILQIEKRQSSHDRFGRGKELEVSFREFLSAKNENWYLTTQELVHDEEGRPALLSPPLDRLKADFPWRPNIMGNLIPQNINLWMGFAKDYSSSGLHHDYHDNLYILLQGKKHFDLYPVSEIENMYTYGEVMRVHPNGRVNYVGQPTNADGSDVHAMDALESSMALEKALLRLEDNEDDQDAEEEVELALERALQAEMNGESEQSEEEDDELRNEEEEAVALEPSVEDAIANFVRSSQNSSKQSISEARSGQLLKRPRTSATDAEPLSFSRVDTALPETELAQLFPRFVEARRRRLEVSLQAGEMLFIPAGWFHEVRSQAEKADGTHMALNYWLHPPDAADFDQPYTSKFWRRDWESRGLP